MASRGESLGAPATLMPARFIALLTLVVGGAALYRPIADRVTRALEPDDSAPIEGATRFSRRKHPSVVGRSPRSVQRACCPANARRQLRQRRARPGAFQGTASRRRENGVFRRDATSVRCHDRMWGNAERAPDSVVANSPSVVARSLGVTCPSDRPDSHQIAQRRPVWSC